MESLPIYIPVIFCLTTLAGILIFYKATHYSKPFLVILLLWLALQTVLGLAGFYRVTDTMPPRASLLILPVIILIIILFVTKKGRAFTDSLDIKALTIFSVIRIPVEIVLLWLFINKAVPRLMTFEGRNFDILSGISASFIYYFSFVRKRLHKNVLLVWNFVCLALLLNIVINAVLSIPGVIQQFAFDQPNIAVAYFPFVLLPSCLVPMVLFSHLASIRQIITGKVRF